MKKSKKKTDWRSGIKDKRANDEAIISNYIRLAGWPHWFKGLSLFQINAADSLLNNLRDDIEQETFHRVRITIIILGIDPMIKSKQLKKIMALSRGNDIAFLWFLWQIYYVNPKANADPNKCRDNYTHNEKIILTTISHLDTVTTIRALDKILPKQMTPKPAEKPVEKKKKRQKYDLPYFETLERPIRIIRKPFELIQLPAPSRYFKMSQNPNFVVANELNRWFVDYNVNHRKRMCLGILQDTVKELNIKDDKRNENDDRASIIKCPTDILDNVIDSFPCCVMHKQMRSDEKYRENKLCVQKLKGCLTRLNPGENRKEAMRRKVLKDIDREVNAFQEKSLKELNKEYKLRHSKLQICESPIRVNCYKNINCEEFFEDDEYNYYQDIEIMSEDSKISSSSSGANTNTECDLPFARLVFNEDDDKKPVYFEQINELQLPNPIEGEIDNEVINDKDKDSDADAYKIKFLKQVKDADKKKEKESEQISYSSLANKNCAFQENISKYDYGHLRKSKPEDVFFEAPGHNKPFKFMYEKIFDPEVTESDSFKVEFSDSKEGDEALLDYFKTEWNNEKDKWNKKYKHIDKLFKMDFPKIKINKYSQEYYNPRDKKLMNEMLYDGISELKKDKKYVLASLPEAHKSPILQEWIRIRYGLIYTPKERQEELRESLNCFYALSTRELKVKGISLVESAYITYNCRNYLYKRSVEEREKYERNFRLAVLEPITTFWTAMRPYNYPGGAPRSTFYAYMPSNVYSILVFCPWKTYEFTRRNLNKTT